MFKYQNPEMYTSLKVEKRIPEIIRQRIEVADDLFSTAVSKVGQPIKAIFNWLIEKADIHKVSRVRFTKVLMIYVLRRLTATFII